MPTNTSIYEDHVKELASVQADKQRLEAREKELKKILRDLDQGSHEIAGITVSVQPNRRIDPGLFEDKYPVAQWPHFWEPKINTTQVRKQLAPAEIEALSTEGEPRVVLK